MLASSSINKDRASSLKVPSVIRLSTTDNVDVNEDGDDTTTTSSSNNTLSISLTRNFRDQQKYRSSSSSLMKKSDSIRRRRNTSSSYFNCTSNTSKSVGVAVAVAVAGDNNIINTINTTPSCNIVHRALEVMSKSLKDAAATNGIDCQQQQQQQQQQYGGGQCQQEAGQRPHQQQPVDSDSDDSGDDVPPNDNSKSDDDKDNDIPTPPTIVSSPSLRKIAKKRRKEAGGISFHHTKSSKEYLRKAQEAYQRLHINNGPEQQIQQKQQREKDQQELSDALDSDSDSDTDPIDSGFFYPDDVPSHSQSSTSSSDPIDYGYGDPDCVPSRSSSTDPPIDYGYGDPDDVPSRSSSTDPPIDYGYGDPDDVPSRSSSTDPPIDYGYGDPDAAVPQHPQHQQSRRGGPFRRRNSVTKFSADAANIVAAKAATQRMMLLKPGIMSLARGHSKAQDSNTNSSNNSNINDNGCKARPSPPQRSRCQARGVLSPRSPVVKRCSNLQQMSVAASQEKQQNEDSSLMQIIQPDIRSIPLQLTSDFFNSDPKPNNLLRKGSNSSMNRSLRFTTPARTESSFSSDHTPTRKSLVISWNNSSNSNDGSFAHLPTEKIRRDSGVDKNKTSKYPILPLSGIGRSEVALAPQTTTMPTLSKTSSQTCMPAPVRRTPSNNWQWQE
ncbi:hypothetical protein FRACYDRAFT_241882 [Fragilariopsis cylindrus CCMP1102]|uniref:Uncharacterized protein n=1 Tax=Fragilariopsis cylindrus CCMP1102 TaxID=635003 RepID=A0A1E7F6R3_9STRA|nr:hypothetical protein FRACYDRAFT_241882 [Fragilariopsis cylindrus CCMP1102]|eukprot:OEU13543.1 hypothetical protein FRACYDRAFT_241882 [Fragilariopsis cylindrus CCMP1102]